MNDDKNWTKWILQTARNWDDMKFVIKQTGIAHIDHEHKVITNYMVEINKQLLDLETYFTPEKHNVIKKMLNSFYSYISEHCSNEENFIESYNLPGLERQKMEHKELLFFINGIIIQFNTGRVTSAFGLRIELLRIVVNHINGVDSEVFKFVNISNNIADLSSWDDINAFIRLIHIPIIDKQHKILTEMIINLIRILSMETSDEVTLKNKIDELTNVIDFTKIHFDTEIDLIKRYRIPGDSIQELEHTRFVSYLNKKLRELKIKKTLNLVEMKNQLLLWWIKHINIFDNNTFRKFNWLKPIYKDAKNTEDVTWLITKVGNVEIDNEHIEFIRLLLELFENPDNQSNQYWLEGIKSLINFAKDHFKREEILMDMNLGLDNVQHKLEHDYLIKTLSAYTDSSNLGKIDFSKDLKGKILTLWISHINDTDTESFGVSYE